ncbi:hypothetical protein [Endozoicomonas acroporae]|uniref:hypothetical protein n=1 Tax=Endozoicomonas acroporae TaxID=1701104 RepID=UPI003D7B7B0E
MNAVKIGQVYNIVDVYTDEVDFYSRATVIDVREHKGQVFARMQDDNGNQTTAKVVDGSPLGYKLAE